MGDPTDLEEVPYQESDQETHRGAFGEFAGESTGLIDRAFRERIVLAGVTLGRSDPEATDASMDELARLVETAGADPVARVLQHRDSPDRATYVGRGKVHEIRTVSETLDADTVVFDNELTPAQQGNLAELVKHCRSRGENLMPYCRQHYREAITERFVIFRLRGIHFCAGKFINRDKENFFNLSGIGNRG